MQCHGNRPRNRLPTHAVRSARRLAAVLLTLALLTSCALPSGTHSSSASTPTPTVTPDPLARDTVYWSRGNMLLALRASNGQVRWKIDGWSVTLPNGNEYISGITSGITAPTLADGALYSVVSLDHSAIYALSAADGTTRWRTPLIGCFPTVGSGYPLLLAGGLIYVAPSGHDCAPSGWVYALRTSDGSIAWQTPFERAVLPTLGLTDGALLVASSTYPAVDEQDYLTALRPSDGRRLWRVSLGVAPYYLAAADGVAVVSGEFFGGKLEARSARDGRRLWSTSASRYGTSLPVIARGLVYVGGEDGSLYALRLRDGTVQWHFAASPGSSGALAPSVPAVADDLVYWGDGPVLYALDARTGALRQTYHLFPNVESGDLSQFVFSYSPSAIADGVLFVGAGVSVRCAFPDCAAAKGGLFAFDAARGLELWSRSESEAAYTLPPVVGP